MKPLIPLTLSLLLGLIAINAAEPPQKNTGQQKKQRVMPKAEWLDPDQSAPNGTKEEGEPLLDRTMVLYGSNLGNASSHDTRNLPMLLFGGGFRHGQHLKFEAEKNPPLANLHVSMLQRLGIETDTFASGKDTLMGLSAI